MKIKFQGREVEATEIDFFARKEDFNEYQLADGNILKAKFVVTRVLKIEGELNPDGSQIYTISSQPVFAPMGV